MASSYQQLSLVDRSGAPRPVINRQAGDGDPASLLDGVDLSKKYIGSVVSGTNNRVHLGDQITINNESLALKEYLDQNARQELFGWLSHIPYTAHHRAMREGLVSGTGAWLLQKEVFSSWYNSSVSSVLWLHGIREFLVMGCNSSKLTSCKAGSGKSRLVHSVIEHLLALNSQVQRPPLIVYFYCSRQANEPERAAPEAIMMSLLKQIYSLAAAQPISKLVIQSFEMRKKESEQLGNAPAQLSLDETVDLILAILKDSPTIIILDALDECDPNRRHLLLNCLDRIIKESGSLVRMFLSSRDDNDVVSRLRDIPNLFIKAEDNRQDIHRYVVRRIQDAIDDKRLLGGEVSERLKQTMVQALTFGADEMFQWVNLQLDNLCDPRRMIHENDILAELGRLPHTLRRSYVELYSRMKASGAISKDLASRTIDWLLCGRNSLDTDSFVAAVSWQIGGQGHNLIITSQQILAACCNLVILDNELNVFRFAHLSVREFFESLNEFGELQLHFKAGELCVQVCDYFSKIPAIQFQRLPLTNDSGHARKVSPEYRLAERLRQYATTALHQHLEYVHDEHLWTLLSRFCLDAESKRIGAPFRYWTNQFRFKYNVENTRRGAFSVTTVGELLAIHPRGMSSTDPIAMVTRPANPAFMACWYGCWPLLETLRRWRCVDWSQKNDMGRTLEQVAEAQDRPQISKWLRTSHISPWSLLPSRISDVEDVSLPLV